MFPAGKSFVFFILLITAVKAGVPRLDGKIVGGTAASIRDYPYQLSLQRSGSHICGASIISPEWALTAAHCVDGVSYTEFSLRAGSSIRGYGGQVRSVSGYVQHPNFNSTTLDMDYAVMSVSSPFVFGTGVQPILLKDTETPVGTRLTVTGWGTTVYGSPVLPYQLQKVDVYINSFETCNSEYGNQLTDSMICAAAPGRDSCQGDSGGPAVTTIDGVRYLVGIVSWGYGCALPQYPGVYSNVSYGLDWISSTTGV